MFGARIVAAPAARQLHGDHSAGRPCRSHRRRTRADGNAEDSFGRQAPPACVADMIVARSCVDVRPVAIAVLAASLLAGCANGDFDRVRSGLVMDNIHDWVGTTAALANGGPISDYPLTDDERLLRDLA